MIFVVLGIVGVFAITMTVFICGYQVVNAIIDNIELDEMD